MKKTLDFILVFIFIAQNAQNGDTKRGHKTGTGKKKKIYGLLHG